MTGSIVAQITNNPGIPFIDAGFNHYREPVLDPTTGDWVVVTTIPCEEYNTDVVNMDAAWNFAKVTAFLSLVLGGGGAMFIWFSTCCAFRKNTWRWAGYELLAATILLAFTFTWFATGMCQSNTCSMHYGARADILANVLWALSTLLIFCKYPEVKKSPAASSTGQQQQQSPPAEVEMTNQSESQRSGGAAMDGEHEII